MESLARAIGSAVKRAVVKGLRSGLLGQPLPGHVTYFSIAIVQTGQHVGLHRFPADQGEKMAGVGSPLDSMLL
jgi:hypothetical protein